MMKRYKYLGFLGLSLFGCGEENSSPLNENNTVEALSVTAIQYENGEMSSGFLQETFVAEEIILNGEVVPNFNEEADLGSYFSGYVKQIYKFPGDKVKTGETILILEHPSFIEVQQNYLDLKSQLVYLEEDYQRQVKLNESNVNSKKVLSKSLSDLNGVKSKLAGLKKELELMHINPEKLTTENIRSSIAITSPVNGEIVELNVTKGKFVEPGFLLAKVLNTSDLQVEFTVYEKEKNKVAIGDSIEIGDESYAVVSRVSNYIGGESRSAKVYANLTSSPDEKFIAGTFITGRLHKNTGSGLKIPQTGVVREESNAFIYQLSEEDSLKFHKIKIDVLNEQHNYVFFKLSDYLSVDQKYILTGAHYIEGAE